MLPQIDRKAIRRRVRYRIRRKISGTAERPRLAVFRSRKHTYVQAIDDERGRTLASASTQEPALRAEMPKGWTVGAATRVGGLIAERLKEAGVTSAVLDRGGWLYHGRIKALTAAAREHGLRL
jgi:large subunit ribosomal protein L18